MNRDIVQTGATLFASSLTSWMTAKHYYLADIEKRFDSVRSEHREIRNDLRQIKSEIDRQTEKTEVKMLKMEERIDAKLLKTEERLSCDIHLLHNDLREFAFGHSKSSDR